MKHAVIVAHPNPASFNLTMARAYQTAAERHGDSVVLHDLYAVGFDPRLSDDEIPHAAGFAPRQDVVAERVAIGDADVFVFVYPLWFDSPPAMMKGYLERVFGMGFGYGPGADGNQPLLRGRRMVSISSSGAPKRWVAETGSWEAIRKLFDEHFSSVCGLTMQEHLHFGDIAPGVTAEAVAACAAEVGQMFERHFGRPPA